MYEAKKAKLRSSYMAICFATRYSDGFLSAQRESECQ